MKSGDDLELNAYIDGELSPDQQAELLQSLRDDPELARDACALAQLKAQVRLAYTNPPRPDKAGVTKAAPPWQAIAAGLALLAVGLVSGWLLHANAPDLGIDDQRFVVLDPDGRGQAAAVADGDDTRIVFHLTNPDQTAAGELLDEVEGMLAAYRSDGRALRVEIVGHSEGLGLLRERLSQHKERIHHLAGQYANLTFVACQNTIDRLKVERGIEVKLIPDAEVIDSGVSHVVRRQKQGWSYIRV
jgi:intracellular sulfur oxidation DsrE/DsrF family protein